MLGRGQDQVGGIGDVVSEEEHPLPAGDQVAGEKIGRQATATASITGRSKAMAASVPDLRREATSAGGRAPPGC